ncbi:phosphohydrolase [Thermosipho melanesiensis]|uniref:Phosphohydrolase n=2 Tax=Thermosipho melanesiensis TaxID=46541 RepID=A0ABM6GD37_9BACT|nr:HD domain-containing protein [Thermosipho melanesiensis]ABR30202.1 putative metal dependent phosphohydrolase [Thermosipho melanesiensis BI429]APT73400.1 phosphohydrolase [Thermosipho melanesiensis]OOC38214.1 phosphohydrolase [Thermosipho melanesiensis]OOC40043.1 phosphohydrolase [Thermosipho melanesiensis]OOC40063.1 phosphohydrolase [Thermosipho melanesiensis]
MFKNIVVDNIGKKGKKLLLKLNINNHNVEFYDEINIDSIYFLSNYLGVFDPKFITPILPKLLNSNDLNESLDLLKNYWNLEKITLSDSVMEIRFEENNFYFPIKSKSSGKLGTLIFKGVSENFIVNFLSISDTITSILEGLIIQKRISITLSDTIDALSEALAKRRNIDKKIKSIIEEKIMNLGKKFGFNESLLKLCAKIYDIGMIGIPDDKADTTGKHIRYGYEILSKIENIPQELLDVVKYHHEKLDGSGPLKITNVPLIAQIVGIVVEVIENNASIDSLEGKYDPKLLKELKHG